MIVHKTTAVGLSEFCGRPDPQAISAAAWIVAMDQHGHTMAKMDWLFEQIREPKIVNLNASRLSLAVSLAVRSM